METLPWRGKEREGRCFSIRQKWIDERGREGTDIICHSSSSFQTRSAREMKGGLAGEMGERKEIEIPDGVDSAHLI